MRRSLPPSLPPPLSLPPLPAFLISRTCCSSAISAAPHSTDWEDLLPDRVCFASVDCSWILTPPVPEPDTAAALTRRTFCLPLLKLKQCFIPSPCRSGGPPTLKPFWAYFKAPFLLIMFVLMKTVTLPLLGRRNS